MFLIALNASIKTNAMNAMSVSFLRKTSQVVFRAISQQQTAKNANLTAQTGI
jgi:hypothetical protein